MGIIVEQWKTGKFTLIATVAIAREYIDVINRPKFKISEDEIAAITDYLLRTAEFVAPGEEINIITVDPTDNKFLEAALTGKADFIVSGAGHLLELKRFRNIPIVVAREFITHLEKD